MSDRVAGERRSPLQEDVLKGVGGQRERVGGWEGADRRLSVRGSDANNPRNSETLTRRGKEVLEPQFIVGERERAYLTLVVLLFNFIVQLFISKYSTIK